MERKGEETTAAKCNVKVNGESMKAIIDSGASVSVITNKLRKQLEIPIERKSKEVLVAANGEKVVAIGETEIEIEIGEWIIPIEVRIVESKDKTLIIGMNTLEDLKARIDIENSTLKIEIGDEEIEMPIEYKRKNNYYEKEESDEDESYEKEIYEEEENNGEEYDEFEEPEYKEFMSMNEDRDINSEKETVFAETAERQ